MSLRIVSSVVAALLLSGGIASAQDFTEIGCDLTGGLDHQFRLKADGSFVLKLPVVTSWGYGQSNGVLPIAGKATSAELAAVKAGLKTSKFATLPAHIPGGAPHSYDGDASTDRFRLTVRRGSVSRAVGGYYFGGFGSLRPRVKPLMDALDKIVDRALDSRVTRSDGADNPIRGVVVVQGSRVFVREGDQRLEIVSRSIADILRTVPGTVVQVTGDVARGPDGPVVDASWITGTTRRRCDFKDNLFGEYSGPTYTKEVLQRGENFRISRLLKGYYMDGLDSGVIVADIDLAAPAAAPTHGITGAVPH